jgi:hypothetical protein
MSAKCTKADIDQTALAYRFYEQAMSCHSRRRFRPVPTPSPGLRSEQPLAIIS